MDEARVQNFVELKHDYNMPILEENVHTRPMQRGDMIYHENFHAGLHNSTVTLNNQVRTWAGQHKIVLREGPSGFGTEIIIQSNLRKMAKDPNGSETYKAKTLKNYPTTEIYFPATPETISFLKESIERIEKEMERINGY